jgi:hypothetical protein
VLNQVDDEFHYQMFVAGCDGELFEIVNVGDSVEEFRKD